MLRTQNLYMVKKLLLVLSLLSVNLLVFAEAEIESYIVRLPDGTEIKIDGNQAYYRCKGKIILLPDGAYLLADGSKLTVNNQKIIELDK
jgi:hypothetical protein